MRRLKQEIDRRRPRAWPEEGRLCPTLRAHSAGVCLSGRCARLVQPSRAVCRVSITTEAAFCVETLEDTLALRFAPALPGRRST
jgi:hypothetical protein